MVGYQIHDVSEKQLKISLWFLEHKQQLAKIPAILLAVWIILTFGYSILGFIDYALDYKAEQKLMSRTAANLIDFSGFQNRHRPKPLIITDPLAIGSSTGSYDFVAQVKNQDEKKGVVSLTYQFTVGDYLAPTSSITILPQQTVYLLSLNNKSVTRFTRVDLNIIDIRWESLWQRQQPQEIKLLQTPAQFQTARNSVRSWVSFMTTNQSLKNIWQVQWQAVLYSGNRIVGVNQITVEELLAGESREIELSWYEKLPKITQIDIVPIVNVYDPSIFYDRPGEAPEFY